MAIPKKGARKITVDKICYRWLIRRKATYNQTVYGDGKLHVAIELEENLGSSLFIQTDRNHPQDIGTKIVESIKPFDIANWIREARTLGWKPELEGKPVRTKIESKILKLEI